MEIMIPSGKVGLIIGTGVTHMRTFVLGGLGGNF